MRYLIAIALCLTMAACKYVPPTDMQVVPTIAHASDSTAPITVSVIRLSEHEYVYRMIDRAHGQYCLKADFSGADWTCSPLDEKYIP